MSLFPDLSLLSLLLTFCNFKYLVESIVLHDLLFLGGGCCIAARGLSLVVARGLLIAVASLVAEHGL